MPREPDTLTGTIKTILPEKGWGFILGTDNREYFFHRSSTTDFDALRVGRAVRFLPTQGPKGFRAEQLEVL
jgi:cold shock CspA family protein